MSTSSECPNYSLARDTFQEVNNAFKIKQHAVQQAEEKLKTVCEAFHIKVKEIENARSNKYYLENYLKTTEHRLKEYDSSEMDFSSEFEKIGEVINKLKLATEEESNKHTKEEKEFDEKVISLTNRMCNGRESYDRQEVENQIKDLFDKNQALAQELQDIKQQLNALTSTFHLNSPSYMDHVILNCNENRKKVDLEVKRIMAKMSPLLDKENTLNLAKAQDEKKLENIYLIWNN